MVVVDQATTRQTVCRDWAVFLFFAFFIYSLLLILILFLFFSDLTFFVCFLRDIAEVCLLFLLAEKSVEQ